MRFLIAATFVAFCCACVSQRGRLKSLGEICGPVEEVEARDGAKIRLAVIPPGTVEKVDKVENRAALILLAGGGGFLKLDQNGCPQELGGNAIIRFSPLFQKKGFVTVFVDSPSNRAGEDGLAGFRSTVEHASDVGKIIALVREKTGRRVWLVGHSRGSLSAMNAAARLTGVDAPDGLIVASAMMNGQNAKKRNWASQTVFDLPLEKITLPTLLVGHVADRCLRSPANLMPNISKRIKSSVKKVWTVTGGKSQPGSASLQACESKGPHGFFEQDEEVVDAFARFISENESSR